MSEVKLNIIDSHQILSGTIHGSVADRCVAALSAEPETIPELIAALARFEKRVESPFATFRAQAADTPDLDTDAWDAGLVVIDMAARIVAVESTYSCPGPSGQVSYHDGTAATDINLSYCLPADWLFVNSVEAFSWSRERRKAQRKIPVDVRKVLYGTPLLEFIKAECEKIDMPETSGNGNGHDSTSAPDSEAALSTQLSAIHARWLTTSREDLGGSSPRDVILEKQDLIDRDLESRALQWSFLDEGPPCLAPDSFAYRFAGFGTHEWVIYYDLVRHLLWCATEIVREQSAYRSLGIIEGSQSGGQTPNDSSLKRLEQLKTDWLEEPHPDYDGRVPAILIDNERKRLPIAMHPRDMMIDDDCPICQAMGDETSPLGMGVGFWHLDGSSMDDEFAFSSCKTLEEWEAENLRREEFNKEFDRRMKEREQRIARGEVIEHDSFLDPDPLPDFEFEGAGLLADDSGSEDKESSH